MDSSEIFMFWVSSYPVIGSILSNARMTCLVDMMRPFTTQCSYTTYFSTTYCTARSLFVKPDDAIRLAPGLSIQHMLELLQFRNRCSSSVTRTGPLAAHTFVSTTVRLWACCHESSKRNNALVPL